MPEVIHVFSEQDSKGAIFEGLRSCQNDLAVERQRCRALTRQVDELQAEHERVQHHCGVQMNALEADNRSVRDALGHLLAHTEMRGNACKLLAVGKAQAILATEPKEHA